uniref:Uncharacterized protein n=1 Tax=Oryza rufipogon TaxID=4529 RepID=A0A0E0RK44_ORYRU
MALPHAASPYVLSLLLLLSIPAVFLLAPRLLPPKTLPSIPDADETDDLALFRRAVLLSAAPDSSSASAGAASLFGRRPQPKVAFLFLTNSDLVFSPLWEKYFAGNHHLLNLYIHADPSAAVDLPATASFRGHRQQWRLASNEPTLHDRYYARGDDVMLPEVPYDSFRVGSQFFVLVRRHAVMVVRDRRLWNKFKLPCLTKRKDSCYPEEHYFPTLLDMQDPQGCTKFTLTRVNWTDSVDGHPHTYRPDEVSGELIRELRKSNGTHSYMFARKFAPDCLKPLMEIADSVILRD